MTKKEIMKKMNYSESYIESKVCDYYYFNRLRKNVFHKALNLYENVSHTKGKEYLDNAYKCKANVVAKRQCKWMS